MRRIFDFLRRFSAIIVGLVLFVSGYLKLMDPVGTGLIVSEYYKLFGINLFLSAKAVGFALALLEMLTAAALLTGVWRKITAIVAGVLLASFTAVTVFLVIKNPEMDCGCFGEAIHLTHTQSLVKNIILCAFWAVAFTPLRSIGKPRKVKYVTFAFSFAAILFFGIYSLRNIPLNDHTPYSSGTELVSLDVPISLSDADGNYCDSLIFGESLMVVTIYDASKADLGEVMRFCEEARNCSFIPIVLVSDPALSNAGADIYLADRRELMTINRSNAGVTYISDGQIIKKWSARHRPDSKEFLDILEEDPSETMVHFNAIEKVSSQLTMLCLLAIIILL